MAKKLLNIFNRLSGLGRKSNEKAIGVDDLFTRYQDVGASYFGQSYGTKFELESYSGAMPWVSASVDAIVRGIVSQEYYFTRNGEEVPEERLDKRIITPFKTRWHGVGFYDSLRIIVPSLLLTGNAYLWRAKTTLYGASGKFPDSFVPVPSSDVKIKLKDNGEGIEHYEVKMGSFMYIVPTVDMIHFKQNAIYSPFIGVGNIAKLRLLVQGEKAAAEYMNSFLVDAKRQPTSVVLDSTPRLPDDIKRLAQMIQSRWSKKVLYFPVDKAEIHNTSMLTKDFDFLALRKDSQDAVIAIFGVPRIVLGLPETSNRATSTNQFPYFYRIAINPRLLEISDAINAQHVFSYDKTIEFNLRKHVSGDVQDTLQMLTNGVITPNQAALRLGETPDTTSYGRDLYYLPANLVPMGQDVKSDAAILAVPSAIPTEAASTLTDTSTVTETTSGAAVETTRKNIQDPRNIEEIVANFTKSAERPKVFQGQYLRASLKTRALLTDKFVGLVSDYFEKQEKEVLDIVASSKKSIEETEDASNAVEVYITSQTGTEKEMVRGLHTSGVQRAIGDINVITGSGINPSLSNPFVKAAIDRLGEKITGKITETTLKGLRAIFKQAIVEGMTINEIQDQIQLKFSEFKTTRARMIARTEARAAWDAGAYVSYTDLGVKTIDVVGCTMFEAYSDCGKQGIDVQRIPYLTFHPNHIGVIAPSIPL